AGRLPHVVAAAERSQRIYLAVDDDKAGRQALQKSRAIRPDLVPLNMTKIFSCPARKTDANAVHREFGADAIIAAIEWCDARVRYARHEICFEAMMRASSRAQGVFTVLAGDSL